MRSNDAAPRHAARTMRSIRRDLAAPARRVTVLSLPVLVGRATDSCDPVDDVVDSLGQLTRYVVDLRYGAGQSVQRIADTLALTQEQVTAMLMGVYRRVAAAVEA